MNAHEYYDDRAHCWMLHVEMRWRPSEKYRHCLMYAMPEAELCGFLARHRTRFISTHHSTYQCLRCSAVCALHHVRLPVLKLRIVHRPNGHDVYEPEYIGQTAPVAVPWCAQCDSEGMCTPGFVRKVVDTPLLQLQALGPAQRTR